jgi:hypothetical protein
MATRRSARLRFRLSVSISMIRAIDGGRIASRVIDSSAAPDVDSPWPRAIAASIEALGKPAGMCKH